MKTIIFTLLFILSCFTVFNQNISGNIKGVCAEGDHPPKNLAGATIRWDGTNIAAASDKDGNFTIKYLKNNKLIISYLGYKNDTLSITSDSILSIMLVEENSIGEVQIHGDQHGEYINQNSNVHIKKITEAGLKKLPCCNLSESFENTADIDVSFSDAVSGAKQIQMLGLAGIYSQILVENIPTIRGLGQAYGLSHIAGPWMQSIQISKGSSAVINGYESITGQINIELQKPDKSDKFYFNLFGNSSGRSEINSYSAIKLNDKLSTILLLHASTIPFISNDMCMTCMRHLNGHKEICHINLSPRWLQLSIFVKQTSFNDEQKKIFFFNEATNRRSTDAQSLRYGEQAFASL